MRRSESGVQPRSLMMAVGLTSCWRMDLLYTTLAALRLTRSSLFMSSTLWGSHTLAQYSSFGRTSVVYARALVERGHCRRFLAMRWSVDVALLTTEQIWVCHSRSLDIIMPKYFAVFAESTVELCY